MNLLLVFVPAALGLKFLAPNRPILNDWPTGSARASGAQFHRIDKRR